MLEKILILIDWLQGNEPGLISKRTRLSGTLPRTLMYRTENMMSLESCRKLARVLSHFDCSDLRMDQASTPMPARTVNTIAARAYRIST